MRNEKPVSAARDGGSGAAEAAGAERRRRLALEHEVAILKDRLIVAEAEAREWWAKADKAIRREAWMRSTWSWRLTGPFRSIGRLPRSIDKRLARLGMKAAPAGGERGAKRFLSRLARSFSKRYRRLRNLPALHAPPPPVPGVVTSDQLSADARLILQRLIASRPTERG